MSRNKMRLSLEVFVHRGVLVFASLMLILTIGGDLRSASAQSLSAEEQLAQKYAPFMYIKEHASECSTTGEPYLPVTVDAILNDPEVVVKKVAKPGEGADQVVFTAPTAQQLGTLGEDYYIDLPGDPRQPGCVYEKWFKQRVKDLGLEPTVYARVVTEPFSPGRLALQYWHFWVFDDFNNTHESDWEMVQLNFDASSAEEALTQDPVLLAFAQHGGAESADWDAKKLERDGNTIAIYPAAGSHASYYQPTMWIGWGAGGTGFGCDDIRKPVTKIQPKVILIPNQVDPNGEFAWLNFQGRWGQRESWEYNGPKSPNLGKKWHLPITWTDDIRTSSLPIPSSSSIGTDPSGIFCSITGWSGNIMTLFPRAPWIVSIFVVVILGFFFAAAVLGWRYLWKGGGVYFRHLKIFVPASLFFMLIADIGRFIDDQLHRLTPNQGPSSEGIRSVLSGNLGIGIHSIEQILVYAVVTPVLATLTVAVVRGERGTEGAYRTALRQFPRTFGAVFLPLLLTGLMTATIVLAPLALYKGVQWLFASQAAALDGANWREARHVSKRAVKGHWIRTLGIGASMAIFSGLPGPIFGIIGLVTNLISMPVAEIISSLVYLIVYPITVIGATLYYLTISRGKEGVGDEPIKQPASNPVPGIAPASA